MRVSPRKAAPEDVADAASGGPQADHGAPRHGGAVPSQRRGRPHPLRLAQALEGPAKGHKGAQDAEL